MPPDGVEVNGEPFRINTDFRAGVAYISALLRGEPIHVENALRLFFPERRPRDEKAALAAISDFLRCGEANGAGEETEDTEARRKPPPYSLLTDAQAIQSEFQRRYGIDLAHVEMHWWRFSALLRGLIAHSFSERVKYRLADVGQIRDPHTRRYWQEMQQLYALDERGEPVRRPQTLEEYNEMLLAQARGERW